MSSSPVREIHAQQPVPMELMIRLANRVNLETMLIVVGYVAVFLRLVMMVDWPLNDRGLLIGCVILMTMVWAVGMYHARLRWCVAVYCGRRPPFPLYCLWPLQSMLIVGSLLVVAGSCAVLGLIVTLGCVMCVTYCLVQSEFALVVTMIVGALPGCIVGFLLAISVGSKLGSHWLKLTS
jgi:hypothetical protein